MVMFLQRHVKFTAVQAFSIVTNNYIDFNFPLPYEIASIFSQGNILI